MSINLDQLNTCEYGVTESDSHITFSLFGPSYKDVSLLIEYDNKKYEYACSKNGMTWLFQLPNSKKSFKYGYQVIDDSGSSKLVLDPYAKQLNTSHIWGNNHLSQKGTLPCIYFPSQIYNWEGISKPIIQKNEWIIYECHPRGFTQALSDINIHAGTFSGIIDKLDYLVDLGINILQLMPIHEFFENEHPNNNKGLYNYWGYAPASYFAIMPRYCTKSDPGYCIKELQDLVKACHARGILVFADIVFNHTAIFNKSAFNHPFIDASKSTYYILNEDLSHTNYTGCGNTVNTNHPIVTDLLINSLQYLHSICRIDGFRFDLASVFHHSPNSDQIASDYFLKRLNNDPLLKTAYLIAEPWDAQGAYHLGNFDPTFKRWSEWNGNYRDIVRSFVHRQGSYTGAFANKITGSEDYFKSYGTPLSSINYICSHDGFSMQDLVSYNIKHNTLNLEESRDGSNDNRSYNHGTEGPSKDPQVLNIRNRQIRNFISILFSSQGIPMISMGDDIGQSHNGNNNPWCHDSPLNWLNWSLINKSNSHLTFIKNAITIKKNYPHFNHKSFLTDDDIQWFTLQTNYPMWDEKSNSIGCLLSISGHPDILCLYYFEDYVEKYTLPVTNNKWKVILSSSEKNISSSTLIEGGKKITLPPSTVFIMEATE